MKQASVFRRALAVVAAGGAALLAACTARAPTAPSTEPTPAVVAPPTAVPGGPRVAPPLRESAATNARAYRQDAASHLYSLNADRIHKGRLPPLLYAIGVLEVDLDTEGHVRQLNWRRAPRHAPEVIAEIERTVRAAAPFPAPTRMGRRGVVYTETWLWDKSGRFQLDTLTEGQD